VLSMYYVGVTSNKQLHGLEQLLILCVLCIESRNIIFREGRFLEVQKNKYKIYGPKLIGGTSLKNKLSQSTEAINLLYSHYNLQGVTPPPHRRFSCRVGGGGFSNL